MPIPRREEFFLKLMVFGAINFQPDLLETDYSPEDDAKSVRRRFNELPSEKKKGFREYFRSKPFWLDRFPIQIYKLTGRNGDSLSDYRIHFQYDLPDRKTEAMRLVLSGFDMKYLKDEYYSFAQLHELRRAFDRGTNIAPLLNNGFSRFQLKVLAPAIRRGFDIQHLLDPSISAIDMFEDFHQKVQDSILYARETQKTKRELDGVKLMEQMLETPSKEALRRDLNHQINHARIIRDTKNLGRKPPQKITDFPGKSTPAKLKKSNASKGDMER